MIYNELVIELQNSVLYVHTFILYVCTYSTVCTVPNFSKNTQNFRGFANMLQNTGGARLKAVQGRAKTVSPGVWNLTEPIFTEVL